MANRQDRPLIWLKGEVKTPPFSAPARLTAGVFSKDRRWHCRTPGPWR